MMMHLLVSMYKISVLHVFAGVCAGFEDSPGSAVSLDLKGDDTAVALEVGRTDPTQPARQHQFAAVS